VYDILYNEENKSNGKQIRTSRASDGSKNGLSEFWNCCEMNTKISVSKQTQNVIDQNIEPSESISSSIHRKYRAL
jgi:hypothetical protein